MMATGFCWHELFGWHDAGRQIGDFVEPTEALDSPATKRRFRNLLEVGGLLDQMVQIRAREATDDELARAHSREHLARIAEVSETGGSLGRMAYIAAGGLKIVRLSAGGAIAVVDAVLNGDVTNAYALLRPAGHHAGPDTSAGFCIVNNVAIAARHAIEARGLKRVAIVDWDVHWGNGTQSIFWHDPSVLAVSLHQNELFSVRGGYAHETGEGAGQGTTLNVPLPPGSGHGAYIEAFESVVVPALERYRPELILVASGLDALATDSYGRMNLHSDTFRRMTSMLMESANRVCSGNLAFCHEGGYSAIGVPFAGLAIIETLSGLQSGITDPFLKNCMSQSDQVLAPHQRDAVMAAARNLEAIPAPNG